MTVVTPQRIRELIRPLLEGSDFELLDVRLGGGGGRLHITIFLDGRTEAITLDQCAKLSRRFEEQFDMRDDIPRNYALDVSSPGFDWPLEKDWQFRKNVGRTLQLTLLNDSSGNDKKGTVSRKVRLTEVKDDVLIVDDGEMIRRRDVVNAHVAPPW